MRAVKVFAFLLAITVCFGIMGCSTGEQENTEQTAQQPEESTAATETTESNIVSTEGNTGEQADISYLGLGTLEEYKKHFAEKGGCPDSFITYEDLSSLGSFESFVCQSYIVHKDSHQKEYIEYQYGFSVDEVQFTLIVRPTKYIPESNKKLVFEDVKDTMAPSDLRTNNTDAVRGKLVLNDYSYLYLNGKLTSIKWTVGETAFSIFFEEVDSRAGTEGKWPENDPDTLIGRMLIWDTAEEALGELRQKIDGKIKDLKYPD